jgi:hypothetical protein
LAGARGHRAHAILFLRGERGLDELLQQRACQRRIEARALGVRRGALQHLALAREVAQQAALRALYAPDLGDQRLPARRQLDQFRIDAVQRTAQFPEIHGRSTFKGRSGRS